MSLQWDDPRLARLVQQIIDRQVSHEIARTLPQPRYGTVVAINVDTREATVRFSHGSTTDDIPHVPLGDFTPRIGQEVLVMRWPASGDIYIKRAVGEDVLVRRLADFGIL